MNSLVYSSYLNMFSLTYNSKLLLSNKYLYEYSFIYVYVRTINPFSSLQQIQ